MVVLAVVVAPVLLAALPEQPVAFCAHCTPALACGLRSAAPSPPWRACPAPRSIPAEVLQPPVPAVHREVAVAVSEPLVLVDSTADARVNDARSAVEVPERFPELFVSQVPVPLRQSALAPPAPACVATPHELVHVPDPDDVPLPCAPSVGAVLDERHPAPPSQLAVARSNVVELELRQSPEPDVQEELAFCFPVVELVLHPCFDPVPVHDPDALSEPEPAETLHPDDTPDRPTHRSGSC